MKVAIKTHNRVNVLKTHTLAMLDRNDIHQNDVYLFVSSEQQRDIYSAGIPEFAGNIVLCPETGARGAAKHIQGYFPPGTDVIHCDDDIRELVTVDKFNEVSGRKWIEVKTLPALAAQGFAKCREHKTVLWGVNPVWNRLCLRNTLTTSLAFIWAGCYGFIAESNPPEITVKIKDDFERSIAVYLNYGAVVRFNYVCCRTRTGRDGEGANTTSAVTEKLHLDDVMYLHKKYPFLVQLHKKKTFGGVDIRLRDMRKRQVGVIGQASLWND